MLLLGVMAVGILLGAVFLVTIFSLLSAAQRGDAYLEEMEQSPRHENVVILSRVHPQSGPGVFFSTPARGKPTHRSQAPRV
jgi:hypothetical protein